MSAYNYYTAAQILGLFHDNDLLIRHGAAIGFEFMYLKDTDIHASVVAFHDQTVLIQFTDGDHHIFDTFEDCLVEINQMSGKYQSAIAQFAFYAMERYREHDEEIDRKKQIFDRMLEMAKEYDHEG